MTLFRRVLTYRLTLYYLAALVLAALGLSAAGQIHQSPGNLAFTALLSLGACYGANALFAHFFGAKSNWESVAISALILVLILSPVMPGDFKSVGFFVFAAIWAMASKYMLATGKRHLFNPAAFGAALASIALGGSASWWVGDNTILLPVIVLGGLLVMTRLHYYELLASFAVVVLGLSLAFAHAGRALLSLSDMTLHSAFFFFAFIMLTEPRTVPLGRWRQVVYGALVGLLFFPEIHLGNYYFTPEVALLIGNLFTYVSNRRRMQRWAAKLGFGTGVASPKTG